jgi:hypothetical protein
MHALVKFPVIRDAMFAELLAYNVRESESNLRLFAVDFTYKRILMPQYLFSCVRSFLYLMNLVKKF